MNTHNYLAAIVLASSGLFAANASAGIVTTQGAVTALTDISQFTTTILGSADFEGVPVYSSIPVDAYASTGLTFLDGSFSVGSTTGIATAPQARDNTIYFPSPIGGGGSQTGNYAYFAGVAAFAADLAVTQFGLTASRNGTQYLTAWDTGGALIGQLTWTPDNDASFIGIDTGGTAIGTIAYGNDDLFGGASYSIGGATIMSDNWIWAGARLNGRVPAPTTLALLGIALLALGVARRRKRR